MNTIWMLAFKNILKYKRRTALTFLILSFGVAFYILMVGLVEGYKNQSLENTINFDTGHFKIRSQHYDPDTPYSVSNFITDYKTIEENLQSIGFVTAYTERVTMMAEIDNGRDSTPCVVTGIHPENDPRVFNLSKYLVEGGSPLTLGDTGKALIGSHLAKEMKLSVHDPFYITFRNGQGMIDSVELQIVGILNTTDPIINGSTVMVTLSDAQHLLNIESIMEVTLKTENAKKYKVFQKTLERVFPDYQVLSYVQLGETVIAAAEMDEYFTYFFAFFILIIALVGIINTMLMSVFEKTKEIGTLKALGMKDGDILKLFITEGAVIGLLGGLLGVILGVLFNLYMVNIGYDITAVVGEKNYDMMAAYRLMGVIYSQWNIPSMVFAFLLSLVSSIIASYYPAKKATLMQPALALRTVQ